MKKPIVVHDNGSIQFSERHNHQNPWSHVAESVDLDVDAAGQGSHVDYDVAILNVRNLDDSITEVIIGTEQVLDNFITALELVKKKLQVKRLRKEIRAAERTVARLEQDINGHK